MTSKPGQLDLDFQAPVGNGYGSWEWDQREAIKKISGTWGLPINRKVRLKLFDIDSEFEGILRLDEFPLSMDKRRPLTLRLTPLVFSSLEIEQCMVIQQP